MKVSVKAVLGSRKGLMTSWKTPGELPGDRDPPTEHSPEILINKNYSYLITYLCLSGKGKDGNMGLDLRKIFIFASDKNLPCHGGIDGKFGVAYPEDI